jgi:group I intron endonuclease
MAKEGLKGGVYLWMNKSGGKTYVGSSVNLYSRISYYFGLKKLHGIIGSALLKYGLVNFILTIIFMRDGAKEAVLSLEQEILDNCICEYNILPTAGSSAGLKHTEETKAKISECLKGNTRCLGRELSDESRAKISAARKGQKLSEEHKAKISAKKGKAVYLYVVRTHGLELNATFPNRERASETLVINRTTLFRYLKNRTLFQINGLSYIISWVAYARLTSLLKSLPFPLKIPP